MLKRQEIPYYTSILFIYKSSKCKVSENTQPEVNGKQLDVIGKQPEVIGRDTINY
jgi:hypothetical protein